MHDEDEYANDEPGISVDEMEQSILNNIDDVSIGEIRYFVEIIRDCENVCPLEKKIGCKIFNKYESSFDDD